MGGLVFPLVDKDGELAIHCLTLFSRIFISFQGILGTGFGQRGVGFRSSWRKNCLTSLNQKAMSIHKDCSTASEVPGQMTNTGLGTSLPLSLPLWPFPLGLLPCLQDAQVPLWT